MGDWTLDAYRGRSQPAGGEASPGWPNRQTALTAMSVVINTTCELAKIALLTTQALNMPVKIYSSVKAIQERSYSKCVFNFFAFSALFFPQGHLVAIGIDLAAECVNAYRNLPPGSYESKLTGKLDPTVRENALKILGLTEAEASSKEDVKTRYEKNIQDLTKRKQKMPPGSVLEKEIQQLINDARTAY